MDHNRATPTKHMFPWSFYIVMIDKISSFNYTLREHIWEDLMNQNKDTIVKPSILSGFLELLPEDQIIFNNMLDTIKYFRELRFYA